MRTPGNHPVAEIGPAHCRLGADLRSALEGVEPPDERFEEDINSALGLLTTEEADPTSAGPEHRAARTT